MLERCACRNRHGDRLFLWREMARAAARDRAATRLGQGRSVFQAPSIPSYPAHRDVVGSGCSKQQQTPQRLPRITGGVSTASRLSGVISHCWKAQWPVVGSCIQGRISTEPWIHLPALCLACGDAAAVLPSLIQSRLFLSTSVFLPPCLGGGGGNAPTRDTTTSAGCLLCL